MKKYDYLIIGARLFGAVFAHKVTQSGKNGLVIDKRFHNEEYLYCGDVDETHVCNYGAHLFHADNKNVWSYLNSFAPFNCFINITVGIFS